MSRCQVDVTQLVGHDLMETFRETTKNPEICVDVFLQTLKNTREPTAVPLLLRDKYLSQMGKNLTFELEFIQLIPVNKFCVFC